MRPDIRALATMAIAAMMQPPGSEQPLYTESEASNSSAHHVAPASRDGYSETEAAKYRALRLANKKAARAKRGEA